MHHEPSPLSHCPPPSDETVFFAALEFRSPAEREAFLNSACGSDGERRRRVEALLDAHLAMGDFMEKQPAESAAISLKTAAASDVDNDGLGRMIGPYKLLQKLGEGGCGVVYMAEQEAPVRRRVAVKVIKSGMDTKQVIARFEAERQALAMMDHPNIAKVYDAGATTNGRPYFVMELVRGIRITEFCDQHRLTTPERLQLFIQVCQAVQHAHHKGIIHRDLKPSNILVTIHDPGSPGVPKIIDFGIAKATQGKLTDQTLFTAFEQFLGTPAYMSPEQAMMTALDVDTRSDVYALGVLLYELLTGRTPFDAKELLASGFEAMRRTIREKAPVRPSTRLSTLLVTDQASIAQLRQTDALRLLHTVRGDLDWIVMKCLEKDRARRYETADALALDLRRHLKDEPVLARPPSRWYEFQKIVRRHKLGFSAAAVVVLALAGGLWLSAREAGRARRAQEQTRRIGYIADMELANRALDEDDLGTARNLLRRYCPEPREADLRNWEWRYLAKLSDGDPHIPLVAHVGEVLSLGFLNDKILLTGGASDWRTILWDVSRRQPSMIVTNLGSGGGVSSVIALAPSRNVMFFRPGWSGANGIVAIDLQRGVELNHEWEEAPLPSVPLPIRGLEISPGLDVLSFAYGDEVKLWDLDRKDWIKTLPTESGPALQGVFSPDGRMIVVADKFSLGLWSLVDFRKLGVLSRTNDSASPPGPLGFSPDARWLAAPGGKAPTQIWSLADKVVVAELRDAVFAERAVFSPDGRWLAVIGGTASVRLWDTSRWRKVRTLRAHTDPVISLAFSPNSRWLATGARNGEVKVWSMDAPPTAPERVSFPAAQEFRLSADGSAFGRIVLSLSASNRAPVLSAEAWTADPLRKVFSSPVTNGVPRSGVVLRDGRGIILGFMNGSIGFLGPMAGDQAPARDAHQTDVYLMDVSTDGSTLATKGMKNSADPENQIRVWRLPGMTPIAELPDAVNVHGIKLSDDGQWLAAFTGPGDMGLWKIPSMKGAPMWRAVAARQQVNVCAFSRDNRLFAAAPPDGSAFIWELATRRRVVLPRALTCYNSLSFSPDGSRLAAGSEGESKMFDTATGQVVLSLRSTGLMLAFGRNGENVLAVSDATASVLHAPPLEKLRFDWLKERPSDEPPPYLGPNPAYRRPDSATAKQAP